MKETISRRRFLSGSAVYGGALWLTINLPRPRAAAAAEKSKAPSVLSDEQWQTLEAMCGRIRELSAEVGRLKLRPPD